MSETPVIKYHKSHMLHVWYIHLHDWVMFRVNVRKEYSTMEHLEYYYLEFALFVLDQTNSEKVFGLLGPPTDSHKMVEREVSKSVSQSFVSLLYPLVN